MRGFNCNATKKTLIIYNILLVITVSRNLQAIMHHVGLLPATSHSGFAEFL